MNPSLVKPMYYFTLYEKLKRVTITLEENEHPILFASFETLTESFLASINLLHSKELPFDI